MECSFNGLILTYCHSLFTRIWISEKMASLDIHVCSHWPILQLDCFWQLIWSCLLQGLLVFSNLTAAPRQFHWRSLLYEKTCNKNFLMWICPLVYSLIGYNNDVILRLCQDIMLLKAEVADLLLPSVIVDLARKKNTDIDLHELISLQPNTYGSESRSTSTKATDSIATSNAVALSTSSWDKVYWLTIDYLLVAK